MSRTRSLKRILRITALFGAALGLVCATGQSPSYAQKSSKKSPDFFLIHAGELLAVPGKPTRKNQTVVVHDGIVGRTGSFVPK